ncbi:MAG: ribonucleoside triphosphate reductase, partial [Lachnospiraceae bacterium]|nr:ribonucleoside triphosphate reductase [Lachnospiraceae bacterium]
PYKYKDCKKEMDMINKAFIEVMIEGDANGRGFQYPIPTYSITPNFDWSENENNKLLFEMTAKYGTPYFSNYVNSDMKPSDVRSMCCRLRLDLRELRKKSGGFFGSGESTGSVGVVTINLPRIAYLAKDEEEFYKRLDEIMDISARSLHIKREVITSLLDNGLYPYTKRYLGTFNNHFSTIGLVGMNETCLNANWLKADLTDKKAQQFAKDVLNHMRERLIIYQEKYGDLYNLEATPAESTSYRLAKHDKEKFPKIITANEASGVPYYTNSSHLPVGYTDDIFTALDVQDELQTLYTSGTVFHTFLGEKLPDWKAAMNLVRKIANNYKLPYYTMSPTYSICQDHG